MKFLCLGYMAESTWTGMTKQEQDTMVSECLSYDEFMLKNGYWTGKGEPLQSAQNAKTLRLKDGKLQITDGPYAETKEQLGGFGILAADNMEHAIEVFSKHPGVKYGPFEIRPIDEATTDCVTNQNPAFEPAVSDPSKGQKFVCFGCFDEASWNGLTPDGQEKMRKECMDYAQVLAERGGAAVSGAALQGVSTAKTLRYQRGNLTVTDGPFAETKEQIGGVAIYRFKNIEQAIEAWQDHPCLKFGDTLELRPVDEPFAAMMDEKLSAAASS